MHLHPRGGDEAKSTDCASPEGEGHQGIAGRGGDVKHCEAGVPLRPHVFSASDLSGDQRGRRAVVCRGLCQPPCRGFASRVIISFLGRPEVVLDEGSDMGAMDDAKHNAEKLVGKAKEGIGDATDNERLQAEGKLDQAKAEAKKIGDDVKDAFDKN